MSILRARTQDAQEILHVKLRLGRLVACATPDRTNTTRPATQRKAVAVSILRDIDGASGRIVAVLAERRDRTDTEAGLLRAGLTRVRPLIRRRQVETFSESQTAAEGVPQAMVGVDQDAERRAITRPGAAGPTLKWQWRLAERENSRCTVPFGDSTHHLIRPAVEATDRCARCRNESMPHLRPYIACQHQGSGRLSRREIRHPIAHLRVKSAA